MVSSTNTLVQYKEIQNVSSTTPIRLNEAFSICWSGAETEMHIFKMAANFREKRTLITLGANPSICHLLDPPLFFITHYL
jgi:hypothetical protein